MALSSIPGVVEVRVFRGEDAAPDAPPDFLVEIPHGATRAADFTRAVGALRGDYPDDLIDFFFVNTDVGAPELGEEVAQRLIARRPETVAVVLRAQVPRTLIDLNRVVDLATTQRSPDDPTPGLQPYITHPADQMRLLDQHAAYTACVDALFAQICAVPHGMALMMHTYSPRSVGVTVDGDIVAKLREAWAPDSREQWPLRPEVDIICRTVDGELIGAPQLLDDLVTRYAAAGVTAEQSATYALHPVTTAAQRALAQPEHTLCVEVRRDLLVPAFTPFAEMIPDPQRTAAMAAPIAEALASWLDYRSM